jgi:putative ABC transport system ATP-binding protein
VTTTSDVGDAQEAGLGATSSRRAVLYRLVGVERVYRRGGVVVRAVSGIDLEIAEGDLVALEGPSGSGKSTLLQLLGGLESPTKGSIVFGGAELARLTDRELTQLRAKEIGFVFQHFNLIPTLTAEENVAIAMVPNHVRGRDRIGRARELLDSVGLGHRLGALPSRLSGGEQQRVAIARALANHPRVLIADEPTGALDSETASEVMGVIEELQRGSGLTVVIATHDESVARRAARRVRLRDGRILSDSRVTSGK